MLRKIFSTPARPKMHLDLLKLLAIFLVLFTHTGNNGFWLWLETPERPWHFFLLAFSVLAMVAVPLFFMVSGALLLNREESYRDIFFHRVLRYAVTLVIVSFILYVYNLYSRNNLNSFSITDFLTKLYQGRISTPLWYLYAYLAFLIMLPLLRKIAAAMEFRDFFLLILAWEITQLLPVAEFIMFPGENAHNWNFSLFISTHYAVYSLCGYYLEHKLSVKHYTAEGCLVLFMLSAITILVTCFAVDWRYRIDRETQAFYNILIIFPSITLFYMFKMFFANGVNRHAKLIFILASSTFGVYLFEVVWRDLTMPVMRLFSPIIGNFWGSCLHVFVACLLGAAITLLWKIVVGVIRQLVVPNSR